MSTSFIKRQIRRFHVVVVQWTSKKCTKNRDARAELLFWSLNLLLFWSRRCGRRRSCLSSLMWGGRQKIFLALRASVWSKNKWWEARPPGPSLGSATSFTASFSCHLSYGYPGLCFMTVGVHASQIYIPFMLLGSIVLKIAFMTLYACLA